MVVLGARGVVVNDLLTPVLVVERDWEALMVRVAVEAREGRGEAEVLGQCEALTLRLPPQPLLVEGLWLLLRVGLARPL